MLRHHKHTTVVSVQIFQVKSSDPSRHFQLGVVTAINSLTAVLSNHLCFKQVVAYEQARRWQFEYVISTREDVIYFMPMNITALLRNLRPSNGDGRGARGQCDGVYQDCMGHAGYSLRFGLYTRSAATAMMTNERLSFYSGLLESDVRTGNFSLIDRMQAFPSPAWPCVPCRQRECPSRCPGTSVTEQCVSRSTSCWAARRRAWLIACLAKCAVRTKCCSGGGGDLSADENLILRG
jgi:hypothetical protein